MAAGWTAQQLRLDEAVDASPANAPSAPPPTPASAPPTPASAPAPPPQPAPPPTPAPAATPLPPPRPGEAPDRALSVGAFFSRVRVALARAFPDEIWVTGEIRQVKESRGHHYLELTDHLPGPGEDPRHPACLEATCWARDWPPIRTRLKAAGITLVPGLVVRIRGRVTAWEGGGGRIRFSLTGIDIESLLGDMAAARARLLASLREAGLLERNRSLPVPLVPLRVGLVTSSGSEAHRDFVGQLDRSGFRFDVVMQHTVVQGPGAPTGIAAALRRLRDAEIDVAVLVRGGGGRGDLVAFDSEPVARAIAGAPFPVWTGVGHTGDRSVADEVANRALITPSACGEALVARVAAYWEGISARARLLSAHVRGRLDQQHAALEGSARRARQAAGHQLERHTDRLGARADRLAWGAPLLVDRAGAQLVERAGTLRAVAARAVAEPGRELQARREVLRAYDPRRQLERGWTLTRDGTGQLIRSVAAVETGGSIVTILADGSIASTVTGRQPEGGSW